MMEPINCESFRELLEQGIPPVDLIEHLDHIEYEYTQYLLNDEHRGAPCTQEAVRLYYLHQLKACVKAAIIK